MVLKMRCKPIYKKGNYAKSLALLCPLAEEWIADAQNNLGVMYVMGKGVTQDYVRAHMWFNFAASKGDEQAKESRVWIAKEMTPSQIDDAQRMARDCEKKNYKNRE